MTPTEYSAIVQPGMANEPPIIFAAMLLNLSEEVLHDVTVMRYTAERPVPQERVRAALHRDLANVLRVVTVFALAHGWSLDELMAYTVAQVHRESEGK